MGRILRGGTEGHTYLLGSMDETLFATAIPFDHSSWIIGELVEKSGLMGKPRRVKAGQ